ncbi:MAG: Druantia anti-phage system protein DruA [Candidatus Limnocylindria bacterium]
MNVDEKDAARRLHGAAVEQSLREARHRLAAWEDDLLAHFAHGPDVQPAKIIPRLVLVEQESQKRLFRYAALHWSIPVSSGYGRRLRYLVEDAANGKLIGIIGLADPVFALTDRDKWIGWSKTRRERALRCVMDAFVLGAVPPYSMLLGGKLVAVLATSAEIEDEFWRKYGRTPALISGRRQRHRLAMITTTSAYGRSSLYNRIRLDGRDAWIHVGATRGHGEFLFSGRLYERLHAFVDAHARPNARAAGWGKPIHWRNRREVVRKALGLLDLPYALHVHGLERAIYVAPLGPNAREWLAGGEEKMEFFGRSAAQLAAAALTRWVLPRAERDARWKTFDAETLRLWSDRARRQAVRR